MKRRSNREHVPDSGSTMKKTYIAAGLLFLLAFIVFLGVSPVSAVTVAEGDYAEFQTYAPGTDSIVFYVLGQNKFYYSSSTDVSNIKLKGSALKEYLKEYRHYLYRGDDGYFTIYLMADEDASKGNHFSTGEYRLIVHHPGADGIYNTKVVPASGNSGYSSGDNVFLNDVFQFNIPAVQNIEAAKKLTETITQGNDPCSTILFSVIPREEKQQTIELKKEEKENPVPETPVEPVQPDQPAPATPAPLIGIIAALSAAALFTLRR